MNFMSVKSYKQLEQNIIFVKIDIQNTREAMRKVNRMSGLYGPREIGGIDYSAELNTKQPNISLCEGIQKLKRYQMHLKNLELRLKKLQEAKTELTNILSNQNDVHSCIFYHRFVLGMTQEKAATKIGISVRQLQRIEKKIKERDKNNNE